MKLIRISFRLTLIISTACTLLSVPARSQTQTLSKPASADVSDRRDLRRSSLALLDKAVEQIAGLKSSENRMALKMMAADVLWDIDERRARALYDEVASEFIAYAPARRASALTGVDVGFKPALLLRDIVGGIAKHDVRLAIKLSKAVGDQTAGGLTDVNGREDYTRELELRLALQLVGKDPKLAVDAARQSLHSGVSYALQDFILKLADRDPTAASAFVKDIEEKLLAENFGDNPEAVAVAVGLVRMGVAQDAPEEGGRGGQRPQPVVTRQTVQNLLAGLVAKALSPTGGEPELLSALQPLAPEIQKYAPERLPPLKKLLRRPDVEADLTARILSKYQQLIQDGTAGELLNAASKAPADARDLLYQQAALKALRENDAGRARQITSDFISDSRAREELLSQAELHSLQSAAEGGKVSELREMLTRVRTDEERVGALTLCATALAGRGEKEGALQLLNEAQAMTRFPAKNMAQLDAQMLLAHAYVPVEPDKGFKILAQTIDRVNQLVAAGAVLDGFANPQASFDDDEILLRADGGAVNSVFLRCATELAYFARSDFDRAADFADRFERPETALAARLLLAQSILSPDREEAKSGR